MQPPAPIYTPQFNIYLFLAVVDWAHAPCNPTRRYTPRVSVFITFPVLHIDCNALRTIYNFLCHQDSHLISAYVQDDGFFLRFSRLFRIISGLTGLSFLNYTATITAQIWLILAWLPPPHVACMVYPISTRIRFYS